MMEKKTTKNKNRVWFSLSLILAVSIIVMLLGFLYKYFEVSKTFQVLTSLHTLFSVIFGSILFSNRSRFFDQFQKAGTEKPIVSTQ